MNPFYLIRKFLGLIFGNIWRNAILTILTSLGTMALVLVVTLVYTVLFSLQKATTEKSSNFKAIITERWQVPSQMPASYRSSLVEGAAREPDDIKPDDYMTWGFYVGMLTPGSNVSFEDLFLSFVMEPEKITTMMDELDSLKPPKSTEFEPVVQKLEATKQGAIVGIEKLKGLKKQVGDRIKVYSRNFKGIDLEFEIVGTFPQGRYDNMAIIRRDYFDDAMDKYQRDNGKPHALASKSLALVWLKFKNKANFEKVVQQIESSPNYTSPPVKCETASSGIAAFLEGYRDLLWGAQWLLVPACMATLSLVIANSISISVRERRTEFAVMKVLGFQPWQILFLVLGEALCVGALSGLFSAGATYALVNLYFGGVKFPIAFIPDFFIPIDALWWGTAMGAGTALLGSFLPAWSARTVKVSEVFSRVA